MREEGRVRMRRSAAVELCAAQQKNENNRQKSMKEADVTAVRRQRAISPALVDVAPALVDVAPALDDVVGSDLLPLDLLGSRALLWRHNFRGEKGPTLCAEASVTVGERGAALRWRYDGASRATRWGRFYL